MTNDLDSWPDSLVDSELIELIVHPRVGNTDMDPATSMQLLSALKNIDPGRSVDELGNQLLPRAIDGDAMYAFWPDYWENLKTEFRIFLCSSDKKYDPLRKKLTAAADKSHTAVVSTIAAAMAVHLGVAAGILVPFCAMCLLVLVRTGKEAFCATAKWNMPLGSKAPKARRAPK